MGVLKGLKEGGEGGGWYINILQTAGGGEWGVISPLTANQNILLAQIIAIIDLSSYINPFIFSHICLSVYVSIYPSVNLPIYLSVCMSIYKLISICLCIYLFILCVHLSCCASISIYLFVCMSIYPSVNLSIYLSIWLYMYVYLSIS